MHNGDWLVGYHDILVGEGVIVTYHGDGDILFAIPCHNILYIVVERGPQQCNSFVQLYKFSDEIKWRYEMATLLVITSQLEIMIRN